MYKKKSPQMSMFKAPENFMMLSGLDPNNRWIRMSELIPWDLVEEKYAKNFKETPFSRPAKPVRMAIGTQIIKEKYVLSDDETVEMIAENPYLQYFIGLEAFSNKAPMEASVLTLFRKRITPEMLAEINDYIIGRKKKDDDENDPSGGAANGGESAETQGKTNEGTLILDATCVLSDIRFPTDISLLNEGLECLEGIIDELHEMGLTNGVKPRTYRQVARRDYLRFIRNRKPKKKVIRATIRKQLCYMRRDLAAIETCDTAKLSSNSQQRLAVVRKLYEQQKQMYETKTHQVPDRIVSIHQPWVRPIVRGKATADVEFGAKVAISVRYKEQTGLYPQRILADKIYRTRDNLQYCDMHHIHMSGPKLGRPPKDKALYA